MKDRWRRLSSEIVHDAGIFQLRRDKYTHMGRPTHPFYVLETRTWINVVPITVEGDVVLVRQYRGRELRLVIHDDRFELDGQSFRSLSEAARHVTGSRWNGRLFWGLTQRKRKS